MRSQAREQTKFWRAPQLGDLELLRASYRTHSFARHTHDGFALGVIERGAETFEYRRQWFVAPAGSVVVINPGEVHTGQAPSAAGWSYRMSYPDIGCAPSRCSFPVDNTSTACTCNKTVLVE